MASMPTIKHPDQTVPPCSGPPTPESVLATIQNMNEQRQYYFQQNEAYGIKQQQAQQNPPRIIDNTAKVI